jgi:NitT/TauT family transport system substrate-binding protein
MIAIAPANRRMGGRIGMSLKRCLLLAAALVLTTPFSPSQAADKAILLLNWYLYAEHAPFFLGKERGYFEKEGIDLDIQEGRGSVPTVQAVVAGTATFGYADIASILKAADKGAPVMVVGVLLQKSPMAFIALSEKNIRAPQDLKGKSLALTPGDSLSQILPLVLAKVGMKESDLTIVAGDNRAKLNAVINAQVDAMLGYSMDQNLRIAAATHKPVTVLPFADYGVNLASSSIVVAKDTADKQADLVGRFMRAATKAVIDAENDPAAAVDAMLKASPKAGARDDLIEGLKLTIPLYHTSETSAQPPFRANPAEVKASVGLLAESGTISQASADRIDDLISFKFLPN